MVERQKLCYDICYLTLFVIQITIDEAMFGRMVMIYWRKLMQVLSARIFMVSPSLRNYLELRLSPCLEDDPQSDNFYLAYKQQVKRADHQCKVMCPTLLFLLMVFNLSIYSINRDLDVELSG
jgi:hypothetical protein